MKLTANCRVIMGDGTSRTEPSEVHINPDYITEAWPGPNVVRLYGSEDPLYLDDASFSKVMAWLDEIVDERRMRELGITEREES